ncbi:MAG TPA: histone deacetylase, partial [Myxococcaceae bacterium]|nr:histone deacetylase [Myxococcaceae bacterium]
PIPRGSDPLGARLTATARGLSPERLSGELEISSADVDADLRHGASEKPRLLGYYTASGIEYALHQHGILEHVRRLGYEDLRVELDSVDTGDRFRLFGRAEGTRHLLIEMVVERRRIDSHAFLFVNWLTLRNPRAQFSPHRPKLPGQEVPGLGLGREASALLGLMADRLELEGVLIRPAWYHLAYAGRTRFVFMDPERQGRFEGLLRDSAGMPLLEVTRAVAEGQALLNDQRYVWEPTDFVHWRQSRSPDAQWKARMRAERERVQFTFGPPNS